MPRRETETKAKAFAFVMDQLAWIGDDLLVDANGGRIPGGFRPAKLPYWSCLFPEIGADAAKRSRWQANKGPDELLRLIVRPQGSVLDAAKDARLRPDTLASFDLACIVGWLMRDERGPFAELFSSELHFAERFGREAVDTFLNLLGQDYAGCQPYLFEGLSDALTAVNLGIARSEEGRVSPWSLGFDQYGSYLVRKHRQGGFREDWRADLVTLLVMSALLGPKDYRADLLIDMPEKYEPTLDAREDKLALRQSSTRSLDISSRAFLTRVAFSYDPPDELDWMMCEGNIESQSAGIGRMLSVPLDGKRRVTMARGLPRFSDVGEVVEIPLNCQEASSRAHLVLESGSEGWTVRDMASTNGTLVVKRSGERCLLHRKESGGNRAVTLHNGDVICVAPDCHTGRAIATNPAFLFHYVTTTWW